MLVPAVLAMVICDAVWRDPASGKVTLLGIFTDIAAAEVPVELGQVCVYLHLSGYSGRITVGVDLFQTLNDESSAPIASAETDLDFPDRLASLDGAATLYNVNLPTLGDYHCVLSAGGVPLAERRLSVGPNP